MDLEIIQQLIDYVPGLKDWLRNEAAKTAVRKLLTYGALLLIGHGYVTQGDATTFIDGHYQQYAGYLVEGFVVVWQFVALRNKRHLIEAAAKVQPGASLAEVKQTAEEIKTLRKAVKEGAVMVPDTDPFADAQVSEGWQVNQKSEDDQC
jgi:hypothetical protein